ncbi:hypothetical protein ACFYNO_17255 [Kitasatospora sp. NPDC006697]|uniref:hypothetical protein n=1 Tax=Kitasatospora sp. NPDC006697 TaxID=3364020 RepID=UPI0036A02419
MAALDPSVPWRQSRGRRPSALAVFAALADRSVARISEGCADARTFDRAAIEATADAWDGATVAFVRAATARTGWQRERLALRALEWMADSGAARRRWMSELAAAGGQPLDGLFRAVPPEPVERDARGRVKPPAGRTVTRETAAELAQDYRPESAELTGLRFERQRGRLDCVLELGLARRYRQSDQAVRAQVALHDVTAARFDSADTTGIAFHPAAQGISAVLGTRGEIRAASATLSLLDFDWHLSAAGLRATALAPQAGSGPRPVREPRPGKLMGHHTELAAKLFRRAMLDARRVGHPGSAHRVPLADLCRTFAGAGSGIVAAGAHSGGREREAAFLRLIEGWMRCGGPAMADWFTTNIRRDPALTRILASLPDGPPPSPPATPPARAQVQLARFTPAGDYRADSAEEPDPYPATAVLLLAVPPGSTAELPWRLHRVECAAVTGFRLDTGAFTGTARPAVADTPDGARRFTLDDGALTLVGPADWDPHDQSATRW